jgi:hypothetical protein
MEMRNFGNSGHSLRRLGHIRQDNIKINLKEIRKDKVYRVYRSVQKTQHAVALMDK